MEMRPFLMCRHYQAHGNVLAPVLTGEKLVSGSDCALFTLPALGSCRGCLIAWIEWLQMLGDKE